MNTIKTIFKTLLVFALISMSAYGIGSALVASGFNLDVKVAYSYNKPIVEVHYEEQRKEVCDF